MILKVPNLTPVPLPARHQGVNLKKMQESAYNGSSLLGLGVAALIRKYKISHVSKKITPPTHSIRSLVDSCH